MTQVTQVNLAEGDLVYGILSEESGDVTEHMVGHPHWGEAKTFNDFDLFELRQKLMVAMKHVEDAMEERGLLRRVTRSGE